MTKPAALLARIAAAYRALPAWAKVALCALLWVPVLLRILNGEGQQVAQSLMYSFGGYFGTIAVIAAALTVWNRVHLRRWAREDAQR